MGSVLPAARPSFTWQEGQKRKVCFYFHLRKSLDYRLDTPENFIYFSSVLPGKRVFLQSSIWTLVLSGAITTSVGSRGFPFTRWQISIPVIPTHHPTKKKKKEEKSISVSKAPPGFLLCDCQWHITPEITHWGGKKKKFQTAMKTFFRTTGGWLSL